ncbi:MAG: flagellar biosynthesis protein FlhB [Sphingomonadaceae bacterium]|nr:flagellar biosynthesis protein FlhB [Sphingomonadaceae bacterium]
MAEGQGGEKTESPTARRYREAADKGDVLQSRELGTALIVLVGAGWLAFAGPMLVSALEDMLARALSFDTREVTIFDPAGAAFTMFKAVALPIAGLFLLTLAAAIGTPALLGSLGFRWTALGFNGGKLNPLNGIQRMLGLGGWIELGKSLVKVLLLGSVAVWLLHGRADELLTLGRQDIVPALADLGHTFVFAVLTMAGVLVLIAGVDVPMQIMQRTKRLKMTRQEVKDENRQMEGSPEAKAAVRRKQIATIRGSARQAIQEASVVLTNPTHFAVALRYRAGIDPAPIVVARGRGAVAEAIRDLARESKVPMLSYPQLTRALYFTTRAGSMIREDLYMAVATVLAFVFNLDRALAEGTRPPNVDVPTAARFDEHGRLDG